MGTPGSKLEEDNGKPGIDETWLEGTNVREPRRNSRRIEDLKKTNIKKVRRRPKSRDRARSLDDSRRTKREYQRRPIHDQAAAGNLSTLPRNRFDIGEYTNEHSDDESLAIAHVESLFDYGTHDTTAEEVEDGIQELEQNMMMHGAALSAQFIDRCAFRDKKNYYTTGLPIDKLHGLLRNDPKRFKACSLQIESAHKAVCVLLKPEENLTAIEISGRSKCGKNFSEDEVVVEILNHDHSTYEIPRFHKKLKSNQDFKAFGKIVGKLTSKRFRNIEHPVLLCELDDIDYHLMRPLDKTVPKMHVFNKNVKGKFQVEIYQYNAKTRELNPSEVVDINPAKKHCYVFLVVYIAWDAVYPLGAVIKIMRSDGEINNGLKILEIQYQVPTTHSKDTLQAVDEIISRTPEEPLPTLLEGREDLTDSLSVFTIDPQGSKDLDDALSLRKLQNGVIEVGVHIADVASLVQKGGKIDEDARQRATTFYPGNGKHPHHMIPALLSENRCSLLPHRSRLALSLFFEFSINGKLKTESPSIRKTVVKSRRQFTYAEVQDLILGRTKDETFSEDINTLFSIARLIRCGRLGEAMHALPTDIDHSGEIDSDSLFESPEAHYLVEEFMILSNKTAAQFVCNTYKDCALLRCQDAPPTEKVNQWLTDFPRIADIVLRLQNIKPNPYRQLKIENAPTARYRVVIGLQTWIWTILKKKVREGNFRDAWKLIGSDELHPEQALAWSEWIQFQEKAEYRCLGKVQNRQKQFHFSLGIAPYTHFTSPIRRYADLVTHRLIHAALDKKMSPYTRSDIVEICSQINDVSRRAKIYGKQCKILQHSQFLKRNPVMVNGFIEDVSDQSITFQCPGMRLLPRQCREVALNLLNVACRPTITKDKDDDRPFDILTLTWQKRLYSHIRYAPSVRGYSDIRIDPHQRTTFQQYSRWTDILKALVTGNTELLHETLSTYTDFQEGDQLRSYVPACTSTVKDVSSEVRGGVITRHFCDFSMSFNHAQIVSVQIGAEPQKGVLVPYPQLLELTDNVKFCLQHPQDPVKYLAVYATTAVRSGNYRSIDEYMKTWLPLLLMENTTLAARDDSVTLNDLPVKLNDNEGSFVLSKDFCEDRNIVYRVTSVDFLLNDVEVENDESTDDHKYVPCLDYVCIKCPYVTGNQKHEGTPREKHENTPGEKHKDTPGGKHEANPGEKHKGTPGGKHEGTPGEKHEGTPGGKHRGTPGGKHEGTPGGKHRGTPGGKHEGNPGKKHEGTPGGKHEGTPGEKHEGNPGEKRIWLAHGQVDEIKSAKGKIEVHFKFHATSPRPPPQLLTGSTTPACSVEILTKPKSDRRTEAALLCLPKASAVVRAAALGHKITALDKSYLELARDMETEVNVVGLAPNNPKQREAIYTALCNRLTFIQGPPGTGKTYTGIKLLYLFTKLNRVWYQEGHPFKQVVFCGPSNKSIDLVARWTRKKLGELAPRMVRMYGASHECMDYPIPGKTYSSKSRRSTNRPDEILHDIALHHLIRQEGKPHADEIREFDRYFQEIGDISSIAHPEQARMFKTKVKRYNALLTMAEQKELQNYDVIFCTTTMTTNSKFIRSTRNRIFQCIIDESGMCTEPETLATIIATKAEQVVLIGDHKQLRPVVMCQHAARLGLEKSLFERRSNMAILLSIQYRMNPGLCDFISAQFYNNRLHTAQSSAWIEPNPLRLWRDPETPHIFCHVEGVEEYLTVSTEEGNEQSCSNKAEVDKVVEVFGRMVSVEGVNPRFINIISQYNAQCHSIRKALLAAKYINSNVNTVVASQGGEWDYIIFSTVRSLPDYRIEPNPTLGWCKQNLGFITDEHQINVALSRARKGLVIIGNKHLLKCDDVWKQLLELYERRWCVVDAKDFPPPDRRPKRKRNRANASQMPPEEFYKDTDRE